ncbi:hypothetical protein BGZ65_001424 [Modicella reniformis]|uniref:RPA43 OB domain-containing protein n=1 Tax=Modicella reniformis TaxID=1440133 RepID=A0A9P6LU45_9FUNG|nr:hypothetical protein BGZ65_001424 [Modicella reniformis]
MPKTAALPSAIAGGGPFLEVSTNLYIHLPPCFATKPIEGIQEQLNGFLMRYMPQVDGVVLAHSDLELLQSSGRIMYDSPYCHFWISVKLLVWKPIKGSTLYGTINLQSPDHIGLLLYGTFNASIPSEFIPKDKYEFNPNSSYSRVKHKDQDDNNDQGEGSSAAPVNGLLNGEWVVKGTGESIGHEGVIEFEVSELVRTNDMLTVTGSLMNVPMKMRRPSTMTKSSLALDKTDPVQTKRSAPEEDDDTVARPGSDIKRIKKEKKKDRKVKNEDNIEKDKKDKKEKKEKKEKKIKSEA